MAVTEMEQATMKALTRTAYGLPDVVELAEIEKPAPADDEVLVRIRSASVNPVDWHELTGTPYLVRLQEGVRRPKSGRLGVDFAGTVEAVGASITRFQTGDEVFGGKHGAFAEYVVVREDRAVVAKPAGLSFEQAAAVPVAAVTALQGLRDKGRLQPGQKVLIIGASGGVGTFAVQLAKAFGAEVTGVCSTRNLDRVRSLGADQVVDYTREDFARSGRRYDLVFQVAGTASPSDCRRVLTPRGTLVLCSGEGGGRLLGPVGRIVGALVRSRFWSQRAVMWIANTTTKDLLDLKQLIEAGTVTPVIDRRYPLAEAPEAFRYQGEGHTQGKTVITTGAGG